MPKSKFTAADPALGYLYQVRCALLHALLQARDGVVFKIGIETIDDVTLFDEKDEAYELLQTKHHLRKQASLSNASSDIWKSVRIWIEAMSSSLLSSSVKFYLLTTSKAPSESAASYLRLINRDIELASKLLESTARTSINEENQAAYADFLSLTQNAQHLLLSRIYIIDCAPTIESLDEELCKQFRWIAPGGQEEYFLENIEGWWGRRVLKQLTGTLPLIDSAEIEGRIEDLREQFKHSALPIDDDVLDINVTEAIVAGLGGETFAKQVGFVTPNIKRLVAAIRDYCRAYEQRSRWVRNDVIQGLELDKYERRLLEEWELTFEGLCDEMGADASEEVMSKIGASVLSWAERATIPIRANVVEPFISRGSLHMLSNDKKIGWHPNFRNLLREEE